MASAPKETTDNTGVPEDFPQFNDRYTERDEDYSRTLKSDLPPPPCVDNWYVRPKRSYDWSRDNGRGRGRGGDGWRGGRVHYAGRRDNADNRYNPYGRGGRGGGYQDRRDRHYDQRRNDHGGWNR